MRGFRKAARFDLGLRCGARRFERVLALADCGFLSGAGALLFAHPQGQQLRFEETFLLLEFLEFLGIGRLPAQRIQPRLQFATQVIESRQVFARPANPGLGFAAALLVFGNTGGLFQPHPKFLRLGFDHARNHALLDDRITSAIAQAGAEKQIQHIALQALGTVEVVLGAAVARQLALHRDLVVGRVGPLHRCISVVEHQFDGGAAHRLAGPRSVEDHIVHRLRTQLLHARFAEHPAHRVDHIRFAAAVGADDRRQIGRQRQYAGVHKGLETGQFDLRKAHSFLKGGPRPGAPRKGFRAGKPTSVVDR